MTSHALITSHAIRWAVGLGYQFERFRDVSRKEIVAEKSPFRALRQLRIIAAFNPVSCVPTENEIQDKAPPAHPRSTYVEQASRTAFPSKTTAIKILSFLVTARI